MYSFVLMAAMTTTPEVPDFGRHRGSGCCGEMSCGGGGSSCGHQGRKHRGGGGGCCGQAASCGCCGQMASCGGCGSGCGSQCGGGCGSPCGSGGCGACGGGYGDGMAAPAGTLPPTSGPRTMPTPNAPAPKPMGALSPTSATLVVTGAADAQVTIGGLVSASTSDVRVMLSPTLEPGQTYFYDLTAEVNGVRLTQAVKVQAGVMTEVTLDFAAKTVVMK